MAWRKVVESDLAKSISASEIEAYREAAIEEDGDPIENLILRTVKLVRGYCRANTRIRLSRNGDELPEALVAPAMDYAAYDVVARVPVDNTEDRRARRRDAISLFERVAADQFFVESADEDTEQNTGIAVAYRSRARRVCTQHSLNGL